MTLYDFMAAISPTLTPALAFLSIFFTLHERLRESELKRWSETQIHAMQDLRSQEFEEWKSALQQRFSSKEEVHGMDQRLGELGEAVRMLDRKLDRLNEFLLIIKR